jgi:hypothetical protein
MRKFFFQNLTLGYMTKTLNQIIFFFLHQNQNIFFSNIGNKNIFLEKNHNPPFKLNGRSLIEPLCLTTQTTTPNHCQISDKSYRRSGTTEYRRVNYVHVVYDFYATVSSTTSLVGFGLWNFDFVGKRGYHCSLYSMALKCQNRFWSEYVSWADLSLCNRVKTIFNVLWNRPSCDECTPLMSHISAILTNPMLIKHSSYTSIHYTCNIGAFLL